MKQLKTPCDYPYGHRKNDKCYNCYLKQCKAYGFAPLSKETWQARKDAAERALP